MALDPCSPQTGTDTRIAHLGWVLPPTPSLLWSTQPLRDALLNPSRGPSPRPPSAARSSRLQTLQCICKDAFAKGGHTHRFWGDVDFWVTQQLLCGGPPVTTGSAASPTPSLRAEAGGSVLPLAADLGPGWAFSLGEGPPFSGGPSGKEGAGRMCLQRPRSSGLPDTVDLALTVGPHLRRDPSRL